MVLFDDFDWHKMPMDTFLRITERYPIPINVKGGEVPWVAETIYFTSNDDPSSWYVLPGIGQPEQVTRRIWNRHSTVTHFTERVDSDVEEE